MATKKRAWRKPGNYTQLALFVTPEQKRALKALSEETLIPQQALLRKAIDELLAKHRKRK